MAHPGQVASDLIRGPSNGLLLVPSACSELILANRMLSSHRGELDPCMAGRLAPCKMQPAAVCQHCFAWKHGMHTSQLPCHDSATVTESQGIQAECPAWSSGCKTLKPRAQPGPTAW